MLLVEVLVGEDRMKLKSIYAKDWWKVLLYIMKAAKPDKGKFMLKDTGNQDNGLKYNHNS